MRFVIVVSTLLLHGCTEGTQLCETLDGVPYSSTHCECPSDSTGTIVVRRRGLEVERLCGEPSDASPAGCADGLASRALAQADGLDGTADLSDTCHAPTACLAAARLIQTESVLCLYADGTPVLTGNVPSGPPCAELVQGECSRGCACDTDHECYGLSEASAVGACAGVDSACGGSGCPSACMVSRDGPVLGRCVERAACDAVSARAEGDVWQCL